MTERQLEKEAGDIAVVVLRPAGICDEGAHSTFLAQQIARSYERRLIGHFYSRDLRTGPPSRLIMISFALDDLVAMGQFLLTNMRRARSFWRALCKDNVLSGGSRDHPSGVDGSRHNAWGCAVRGFNVPWTFLTSAVLGVWLMFSRVIFNTTGPLADSDHLVGALFIAVAAIAMAGMARPLRFINIAIGLWLASALWLLDGRQSAGIVSTMLAGLLLIGLSLPRGGRSPEHFGEWDRWIV